ncbi:hypothetical protein HZS_4069 [Henneguya salminicola]|nr:hypothetical protein HZS_4069 [Henneguya salminicola]
MAIIIFFTTTISIISVFIILKIYGRKKLYSGCKPKTLITGASSGLGRELACTLSEHKWPLILTGRNETALKNLAAYIYEKYEIIQPTIILDLLCDVSIEECAKTIIKQHSDIEILINNAGIGHRASCLDTSMDVIHKIIQTNFLGPVYLTKCFINYI